jgi:hypothetical protein
MSWKKVLGSVAPTIATALGGPLAGMATKAITGAIFPGEEIDPQDIDKRIEQAVNENPDILLKVKEVENEFKARMKELDVDVVKIHAGDRDSARKLAIARGLMPQMTLAAVYVLAFATILITVFTGELELSEQQANIANILLGILSAGLLQIMNFFFGSSSGSKEKTAKMVSSP